jgi:16S rRNA processing protein RimM
VLPSTSEGNRASHPSRGIQREPDEGYVAVGRAIAPFGVKGELKVQPLTDNPERFRQGSRLWAAQEPITVADARAAGGLLYIRLEGYADRTSVERFRGAILQVPESDLPSLAEGAYYRFQLIGLTVRDLAGTALGTLVEVIETGANDVYRIRAESGTEIMLPATANVVIGVNREQGTITVDPPAWR